MTPQQYERVQELFLRLRDASTADQESELAAVEQDLRAEVRSLLQSDGQCGDFLESTTHSSLLSPEVTFESPQLPRQVGPYRLLQQIGEGGYGTVFMAEQSEPINRKVAVKLIKPGMDSAQVLSRFHAERQALAMMDHPSIARVFDAGTTESGAPYFVMELVKGIQIHDFCEQNQLNLDERLRLFAQVCRAVHHAHQKGVIHRDLKPSNVLVTMGEAEPLAKVIDFGIAKALDTRLTERTLFTEYGQMMGTLEYMSPEQAEMSAVDIDTRSDVYSLGALLYQLLTGETPLSKETLLRKGLLEIPRLIRESEPATPSSRATALSAQRSAVDRSDPPRQVLKLQRGDLDWIVMKALAKDRRRRYDSARDLAQDVDRYLRGAAVEAHPPSTIYRTAKFVARHRLLVGAGLLVIACILVSGAALLIGLREATLARRDAMRNLELADQARMAADQNARRLAENIYSELIASAWRATEENNTERAHELLEDCLPELRGWEWDFVRNRVSAQPHSLLRAGDQRAVSEVVIEPNSRRAVFVLDNGQVELHDLQRRQHLLTLSGDLRVTSAEFSSTVNRLHVGTIEGRLLTYEVPSGNLLVDNQLGLGGIYDLQISPSGKELAVCTGGSYVAILDPENAQPLQSWRTDARLANISFHKAGRGLIGAGYDGHLYRFERDHEEFQREFIAESNLHQLGWTLDDRVVVLASGVALSIDASNPQSESREVIRTPGVLSALCVTPTGLVAVGGGNGQLRLAMSPGQEEVIATFGAAIRSIDWLPSAREFAVALADGRVCLVNARPVEPGWQIDPPAEVTAGILLPRSAQVIAFDEKGGMRGYDLETGELRSERGAHDLAVWAVDCDQEETLMATVGEDRVLRCWTLPDLELKFEAQLDWGVRGVCVSPDGTWIATAAAPLEESVGQQEGVIGIWDTGSGECIQKLHGHSNWVISLAATPDGSRLISGCENRETRVWQLKTGTEQFVLTADDKSTPVALAVSPDGRRLVIGHRDGWVTSWELADGSPYQEWAAFGDSISGLSVTRDDRVLASSRSDSRLRVQDLNENKSVASFELGLGYLQAFHLSRDESFLALVDEKRTVHVNRIRALE